MSNSNMEVKVTSRNSGTAWEGTVNVPGLRPTKLVRKSDDTTVFSTRSALLSSARVLAKRLGFSDVSLSDSSQQIKRAAKRSTRS